MGHVSLLVLLDGDCVLGALMLPSIATELRIDEANEESFPASDPPAHHSIDNTLPSDSLKNAESAETMRRQVLRLIVEMVGLKRAR